jgi:ABC-type branched-subunit amino acid transport system ATPase component
MQEPILQIKHLSKSFGGIKLFEDVNMTLMPGTINVLQGSNGSGKTTLINMVSGYEKPDEGAIYFYGWPIKYNQAATLARKGIGKMWQEPTVFPNHTVLQNLLVSSKAHLGEYFLNYFICPRTIAQQERRLSDHAMSILGRFKLAEKSGQLVGNLSPGERKLLSISMLFMNDAHLLILDEPFSSVTLDTIARISEGLVELRAAGKTILMIEHKIKFAMPISDNLFRIEQFKIEKAA